MSQQPELTLPPLMWGEAVPGDAFGHAVRRAVLGCDAGLVAYHLGAASIEAALVVAPELPLARAMTMLPLCGVGFQNALGALAPPEVAVHLEWPGAIRVNGARCGGLRAMAASDDPEATPDWLVIGLTVPILPPSEDTGHSPDDTALLSEGCAEVDPPALLEAWARHTLSWLTRWEEDGPRALHAEWRGLAHGIGEEITVTDAQGTPQTGTFLGTDEAFGLLLRQGETTSLIPLTTLLETAP